MFNPGIEFSGVPHGGVEVQVEAEAASVELLISRWRTKSSKATALDNLNDSGMFMHFSQKQGSRMDIQRGVLHIFGIDSGGNPVEADHFC